MLDENPTAGPENTPESNPEPSDAAPAKKAAKRAPRKTTKKAAPEPEQPSLLDDATAETGEPAEPVKKAAKKTAAKKTAAKKTAAKKTTAKKTAAKKASVEEPAPEIGEAAAPEAAPEVADPAPVKKAAKRAPRKTAKKAAVAPVAEPADPVAEPVDPSVETRAVEQAAVTEPSAEPAPVKKAATRRTRARKAAEPAPAVAEAPTGAEAASADDEGTEPAVAVPLFQAPEKPKRTRSRKKAAPAVEEPAVDEAAPVDAEEAQDAPGQGDTEQAETTQPQTEPTETEPTETAPAETGEENDSATDDEESGQGGGRRRRRRGGRRRRKGNAEGGEHAEAEGEAAEADTTGASGQSDDDGASDEEQGEGGSRRRRRRRRAGEASGEANDDPANTVTRVRATRSPEDQITAVSGSTRLEAKKQRRREGREAGRRRAPIVSEAEFLARRESVDRVMVVRQKGELTQIGVLEDKVLVEHYVSRESQNSLIGNVYVGRVQNVLPSMEAAFVDIGKGRNAVLYAGEVNWSALGHKEGQPRKIESVLSSGQSVLVQVTKDPIGHKGARLTSQISLAGRFLVYVPDGTTSGISRKLPDTERARLKSLLKEIVPDSAGVIVRTAAEGASEDELTLDVERLKARWEDIEKKSTQGSAPKLLYGEPDLTLKVVRDLFTEDFSKLVVEGDEAWETVHGYVEHVAPDLLDRVERFVPTEGGDSFSVFRIDEQIAKGLDRKVWLPSGGSLIIDRTEAMTVVDVNTGKFTGSGGNLEETVTKNNLEAAEEIVRQLRLRDIGGIIVVDFIDMVLESNRDLVLRRLVECLGRDRTRHQVAEVTSLGLVQMTRKRIGTGLLEAFSENCEHCQGRGLVVHDMPIEPRRSEDDNRRGGGRRGKGRGEQKSDQQKSEQSKPEGKQAPKPVAPSPKDLAGSTRPEAEALDEPPVTDARSAAKAERPAAAEPSGWSRPEPTPAAETPSEQPAAEAAEPLAAVAGVAASRDTTPVPASAPVEQGATKQRSPEAAEPAAAEPSNGVPDSAPRVSTVTRTRRSARSSGVITPTQGEPVVLTVSTPVAAPVTAAAPPKVTTRSRRRGKAEPAAADLVSTDPVTPEQKADEGADLHVPIKKRGTRKR
ncbi:Rne/Rng family ribonuclease [Nocardioides daejeonensis]|uniref:Rne/Rng family ribonuclease n=1 Tax=Nocardioides daejeonensis TaxID=1046556 RepID=UPI000D743A4D|nr:Rne/Rng family ribonuclease [Nocardioides daejeonensis]